MQATRLTDCTATELIQLYRTRQASPVEATRAVLERIDALNPQLKAFCHVAHDDALASAHASEARWPSSRCCSSRDFAASSATSF